MYHGKYLKNQAKKKKRLPLGIRILFWTLGVLLTLVVVAVAFVNIWLGKIDRTKITGNASLSYAEALGEDAALTDHEDSSEEIQKMQNAYDSEGNLVQLDGTETILLVGSDTREDDENGRSDSMMLATINYDTGKIHLTSLMRTMYVCIPKADGKTWYALNAAYSWGGIDLLIETIETNFKVDIDNYAVIDFSAFESAIDIVGGVDIDLTEAEADYINDDIPGKGVMSGTSHLDGEAALCYSRIRKIDNDFVRTSRQRTVISALIQKAMSSSVSDLSGLATKLFPLINTDLTNTEILSYAIQFAKLSNYDIDQLMLPIENMSGETYTGMMYVSGAELYGYDTQENLDSLHEFIAS